MTLRKKVRKNLLLTSGKEAKRLMYVGAMVRGNTELRTKQPRVFCFFSSEKKFFLSLT